MPYVPSQAEATRLRGAIDRAAFSEPERIAWLLAFSALVVLEGVLVAGGASWIGVVGVLGGFAVMYWRLRGAHLARAGKDRDLHGVGLRSREQRAFTALMLRHVFSGRNPLRDRPEHDPFAVWGERTERAQAPSEE